MLSVVPARSFNERVEDMLARVEYRRATNDRDRDAIFRLRYKGYLNDGGIGPNPVGRFSDPWDDADNVHVFGIYVDGELASTVRFHLSSPDMPEMPALEVFEDVLTPLINEGHTLLDPTRFVIDEKFARIGPEIPFITLRLTSMAAEFYGAHAILATVRAEHVIMYKRLVGHRAISEPRAYPLLRKKIVCMLVETEQLPSVAYHRHPFLKSDADERARIFEPADMTLAMTAPMSWAAAE